MRINSGPTFVGLRRNFLDENFAADVLSSDFGIASFRQQYQETGLRKIAKTMSED
jgi:hypothetical protein